MRIVSCLAGMAVICMMAMPAFADENASLVNSQGLVVGAGPFAHGDDAGDATNSTVTGLSLTGGFTANTVRFVGTTTQVNSLSWGTEADIVFSAPDIGYTGTWQATGPNGDQWTSFDFGDIGQEITPVDPGGFFTQWNLEFIDTFSDGVGADAETTDLSMFFEEISDSNVVDSSALGSLNIGDSSNSFGELALGGLVDTYTLTLNEAGSLDIFTQQNLAGFTGVDLDSEIGIFDSNGILLAANDDNPTPNDTFSLIEGLLLDAGDYTIAVGGFNTGFADGPTLTGGAARGDYDLNVQFNSAIPEPSSIALLGLAAVGFVVVRRRRKNA